jgi:hypothetical protein
MNEDSRGKFDALFKLMEHQLETEFRYEKIEGKSLKC